VASVLLVGSCAAGTHPGAAAVVGKTEITIGDVDKTSRAVTAALGGPFDSKTTLNDLVTNALVDEVAAKRSITVTDAEIAPAMLLVVGQDREVYDRLVKDPVAGAFLRAVAKRAVGTIKLGGGTGVTDPKAAEAEKSGLALVREESKNIDISIAPRFGQWTDGRLNSTISGSLSEESAQAKAKREAAEKAQLNQQPQG
jgi:hypothetical protein